MTIFEDWQSLLSLTLRFVHIIYGIIWLGHLAFLNLVNVPLQNDLDGPLKLKLNPLLLLRVFYWFRSASMYTFLFGWALFSWKYLHQRLLFEDGGLSNRGIWMLFGVGLATVMWFNVWFLIWPAQRQLLGALAKGAPHPNAEALAKTTRTTSRVNLFLSGPMLFGMIVPNNASGLPPLWILAAIVVGAGFWSGLVKASTKVPTSV